MLKTLLLALSAFCFIPVSGQYRNAVEISLVGRYDRHAHYVTNFGGRAHNDTLKLSGLSSGASIRLRKSVLPTYSIYLGVGYYRLGINKIKSTLPFGFSGVGTSRSIHNEDDDSTRLGYSTSRYHYNNLAFTLGLGKRFLLPKTATLNIGAEGVGFYSLSQNYRLMNGYRYATANAKPLEWGINATVGLIKEYGKLYIEPALLIPIYQNLRGDQVFDESRSMKITKWFSGIGLMVRIGQYF